MKKFESPQMTLVHLMGRDIICESVCNVVCGDTFGSCPKDNCPDCECSGFGGCMKGFVCNNAFSCPSSYSQ